MPLGGNSCPPLLEARYPVGVPFGGDLGDVQLEHEAAEGSHVGTEGVLAAALGEGLDHDPLLGW